MKQDLWFYDLTQCEPGNAISRDGRDGTWIAVDYEVEDGVGVMLYSTPGSDAPPLKLRLHAEGWHEIRIGIYYSAGAGHVGDRILCARLSGDPAFSRFRPELCVGSKDGVYPEKVLGTWDIAEAFWKCADLSGQDLIIGRPPRGQTAGSETNIAFVRLVPMDDAGISAWKGEQPSEHTKILIGNYDGGNRGQWGVSTPEDFLAEFECLRDSDFDIALYAVAACCRTGYPSKVGTYVRSAPWAMECWKNGIDPLAEAIKAAHACGVKLFPQNRLVGLNLPPVGNAGVHAGEFIAEHQEWLCTYGDGKPTRHLSMAFQGVRDFYVSMLREWVEDYEADGVNVLFSRSFPFAYYEEPVCKAFQDEYGEDMRNLPVSDERVQRTRARFVTLFLREVRTMLDEVGKAQGRYIPNCYLVPLHNSPTDIPDEARESSLAECLFNALDVPAWIREGLVDYLVLHLHMYGEHDGTSVQPKIREVTDLAKGTRTKVHVDIYPRRMPPRQYRKIAISYYDAGADGLAFWDSYNRYFRASEWAFVKRLGHRDDLPGWEGKGDDNYRVVPLKSLDGFPMGREYSGPTDG